MHGLGKAAGWSALLIAGLLLSAAMAAAPSPSSPVADSHDRSDAQRADRLNREAVQAIHSDLIRAEALSRQALLAAKAGAAVAAEAMANVNLGRIARSRGDFSHAVEFFGEARRLSESIDDRRGLARLAADFAILYSVAGLLDEALVEARRARELYAELGDRGAESSVLITLGNIHASRSDHDQARASYNEALAIKRADGVSKGVGIAINNLADLELEAGNTEAALARIDEAMAMHEAAGDDVSLGVAEANRAIGLAHLGRYEEARRAALRAVAIGERTGVVRQRAAAERSLAQVLKAEAGQAGGAAGRDLLERAARHLANARDLLADTDDDARRESTLRESSEVEELRGNYADSLSFLRAADDEENRRRQRVDRARSDVLAARYQSEQQVAEIASLKAQAESRDAELQNQRLYRRLMLLALLGTTLVLTLFGLGLAQHRRSARALARSNQALTRALAEADHQRGHAQSLAAAKANVLRVAAEDLQQPLQDIRVRSERLLTGSGLDDPSRRQLAAISAGSTAAIQSVRNLIEADALERAADHGTVTRVNLTELVREVAEQMAVRAAAKRQQIDVALPGVALHCEGQREQLAEALENLLDNAIKFGPFGQHIRLSLAAGAGGDPSFACIRVADRGPGLRDEDRERLFGQFQRLSARPTGGESSTGLGLALVKRIAERHHGQIEAENGVDGGAEFRLWLPLG